MLDIHKLMADLSKHHKIFHSEEYFQRALAGQIRKEMPNCEICLEFLYRKKNWRLDIWIPIKETAIELKYRTNKLELEHEDEYFSLRSHGAQPQGRYDFLEDIQRIEQVVAHGKAKSGVAVLLTNDSDLWDPPKGNGWKTTIDADFRLHEGRILTGELAWSEQASDGTMRTDKGKNQPIRLKGSYHLHWKDYSRFEKENDRQFQSQAVSKKKRTPKLRGLGLQRKRTDHLFRYLAVSVK